jgi:hypothetical protein
MKERDEVVLSNNVLSKLEGHFFGDLQKRQNDTSKNCRKWKLSFTQKCRKQNNSFSPKCRK